MNASQLQGLRSKISNILSDISSIPHTEYKKLNLYRMNRTSSEKDLKPYYLIYLLFVELLDFYYSGNEEKISFTIPIKYKNNIFLLQHRKLGMALLSDDSRLEDQAKELVKLINKAINKAKPFFAYYANEVSNSNDLNIINHSLSFYSRYKFQLNLYHQKSNKLLNIGSIPLEKDSNWLLNAMNRYNYINTLTKERRWLAISVIDAFFSFTEHIFIHSAIIQGKLSNKAEIAKLTLSEWKEKFKRCIDISLPENLKIFNRLLSIKDNVRNYLTHGAFGKNNEVYQIHSPIGAMPMVLSPITADFSISENLSFTDDKIIKILEEFIEYYWEQDNFIETIYIKSGLPTILTFSLDNTYQKAMISNEEMELFTNHLSEIYCNSLNMDW